MYGQVKSFLVKPANSSVWAGFTRLEDEIVTYKALLTQMNTAIVKQANGTKGVTKEKENAKAKVISLLVKYCMRAYVWAGDTKDIRLMSVFNLRKSHFVAMSEQEQRAKLSNIRKELNDNIGAMGSVNLSGADMVALDAAILNFTSKMGTPISARGKRKVAGARIGKLIEEIDRSLRIIRNLMVSEYGGSNRDMVNWFLGSKKLKRLPTRHTGIEVKFKNVQGEELQGVKLSLEGTKKIAVSDIIGVASIRSVRGKTYWVVMEAEGMATQRHKLTLKSGRVLKMEVVMAINN